MNGKQKKRILLLTAMLLLVVALFWNFTLNKNGEGARLARKLNAEYGYALQATDIYPAADWQDTSIQALLPQDDLTEAVQVSRSAGLPSDIGRVGHVTLVLANAQADVVITLYLLDGDIELGFEQQTGVTGLRPLGYS